MSDTVINVQDLSKQYRLGTIGTGTLAHDVNRWFYKMIGKEDPYLLISETNDRSVKGNTEYVWSLKDISFSVKHGEVLGIIGRNGAGKSTLLKILSRTTSPTTGSVKIKGRVASLLEVGTGFHPELTGRENIFLNGAILGMRKKEIKRKFDEIVDFSGVQRYVDTPVKRYSSGMYVRLAFAVAAHLESEILIVDEVLAVGDAEFQRKCLGKMSEVSKGEGRTVLFVSHSMNSIKQLCSKGLVLRNGLLVFQGNIEESVEAYLSSNIKKEIDSLGSYYRKKELKNTSLEVTEAVVVDGNLKERDLFDANDEIYIQLKISKNLHVPKAYGYMIVKDFSDEVYIETDTFDYQPNVIEELEIGHHLLSLMIPSRVLPVGRYVVYFNFTSHFAMNGFTLDSPQEILSFSIVDETTNRGVNRKAKTSCIIKWNKIIVEHA
jgi:lipopolysaccharide transport system ATP-binding protein